MACYKRCAFVWARVLRYLDSATTVFVSKSDVAVRKSAWIMRRVKVLQEGAALDECSPVHIPGTNMVADMLTKYLTFPVWRRLVNYMLNVAW